MKDHSFFKPILIFFAVCMMLQFFTGAVLYAVKIGFHPASTLEYYIGSEKMREKFPDRPDRFMQPRTLEGMMKAAVGHSMGYALIFFILAHLLRSLARQNNRIERADMVSLVFFIFALCDIFSGFLVRYGPEWTAWIRIASFLGFELSGVVVIFAVLSEAAGPVRPGFMLSFLMRERESGM